MSLVEHENVPENLNDRPIGQDNTHVENVVNVNVGQAFGGARGQLYSNDAKGPAVAIQPAQTAEDIWADLNKQNPNAPLDHSAAAVGHSLSSPNEGLARIGEEISKDIGEGISQVMNLFRSPEPEPAPNMAFERNNFTPPPPSPFA